MNSDSPNPLTKTMAVASVVEIATGLALMVDPAPVVRLLLGADVSGVGVPLGRSFGVTLFALGVACWPAAQRSRCDNAAFRAMVFYNPVIAGYLAYLGIAKHFFGPLLWPAVGVHAVIAGLLLWIWRKEPPGTEPTP